MHGHCRDGWTRLYSLVADAPAAQRLIRILAVETTLRCTILIRIALFPTMQQWVQKAILPAPGSAHTILVRLTAMAFPLLPVSAIL